MSIASSISAAFWMLSIVGILLYLTALVGAQDPTYVSLAEKVYPNPTIRVPSFELAQPFYEDGKPNFVDFPEDTLKYYGREPHGPLEIRNVLYKKAELQQEREARQSASSFADHLNEISGFEPHLASSFSPSSSLSSSLSGSSKFSVNPSSIYRPPPPPVRREVLINPRCSFDADKWSMHPESSISNAIMFYRVTGITCEKCLKLCQKKQKKPWACRSVVYDSRWSICDLFAVTAASAPFFLVDYTGRDYFEYLAATPSTGDDLDEASTFSRIEDDISIVDCKRLMENERQAFASGVKNLDKSGFQSATSSVYGAIPLKNHSDNDEHVGIQKLKTEEKKKTKYKSKNKNKKNFKRKLVEAVTTSEPHREESHEEIRSIGEEIEKESIEIIENSTESGSASTESEGSSEDISVSSEKRKRMAGRRAEHTNEVVKMRTRTFVPTASTLPEMIEDDFSVVTASFLRTTQKEAKEVSSEIRISTTSPPTTTPLNSDSDDVVVAEIGKATQEVSSSVKHSGAIRRPRSDEDEDEELSETKRNVYEKTIKEELKQDSLCPINQEVTMVDFKSTNRQPYSADIRRVRTRSPEECSDLCARDNECSSSIFSTTGCELASTIANHRTNDLQYSQTSTYSEKICINQRQTLDYKLSIKAYIDYMLVGHVEVVETTDSFENCINICIQAFLTHGFQCDSAMYYIEERKQNCHLNSASQNLDPINFIPNEKTSRLIYFEFPEEVFRMKARRHKRMKTGNANKLTMWSSCIHNKVDDDKKLYYGMKYRYEQCAEKDIRNCRTYSTSCNMERSKN